MSKPRVLIVDDDASISRLIGMLLEKTGRYDVRTEQMPQEASAVAREFQPDLFILDVDMPGKDGGELAREFKKDPALAKTPVIFFTSLISADETGGGEIMRGGLRYMAKTTNVSVISGCIDRALAAAAAGR
jgi:CheY-like chemotaxis protein